MSTPSFYARISFQAKVLIPVIAVMVLLMAAVMSLVNQRMTFQIQADTRQKLETASKVFTNTQEMLAERLTSHYNGLVKEPRFPAVLGTKDPATIEDFITGIFKEDRDADVIIFTGNNGVDFAKMVRHQDVKIDEFKQAAAPAIQVALSGTNQTDRIEVGHRLYEVVSVAVLPDGNLTGGVVTFGIEMGTNLVQKIKGQTQSEILFVASTNVAVSSLVTAGQDSALLNKYRELLAQGGTDSIPAQSEIVLGGETFLCKAELFSPSHDGNGYLLLYSLKPSLEALGSIRQLLLLLGLAGIAAGSTVVWLAVNWVTRPLRQLRKSAEAVGRGDFSNRIAVNSRDECGELAGVFNRMTHNLESSRAELQQALQTLKATQNQLIQSEKLSGIGEFVAGVAHELNNPLTSVMGFSELLQQHPEFPASQRRFMEMIFQSAKRCQKIVQSLLSFARKHAPERKVVCVNGIVESAVEILAYQMRTSNMEVETDLDPALPPTLVDPHQLQQVFLNIINNARQAMEGKQSHGRLRISTERGDGSVRIIFRDNGPGIPPENLKKIFNPFFTTKDVGKGTGLGLSLCYGIVTEHGGTITPHSQFGEGATFVIELPVAAEPVATPEPAPTPVPMTGREGIGKRVLVIDDEDSILQMIREVLTVCGYRVDVARDGETGLSRLRESHYDLALCDWKMPGLNGQQVYERLHATDPELSRRLIFITGDVISEPTQAFLKASDKICLPKPFTLAEFRAALNRILSTV